MFLGIDVGTSGVKAVLVNEAGAIVAVASHGLDLSHPAPLFSEQDPDTWVDAAIAAVDSLASAHPRETAQVRGIGLSGQMHGATLLGADGRPLRPAILWNDGRAYAECAELEQRCRHGLRHRWPVCQVWTCLRIAFRPTTTGNSNHGGAPCGRCLHESSSRQE